VVVFEHHFDEEMGGIPLLLQNPKFLMRYDAEVV
jgi:hypothetical protein